MDRKDLDSEIQAANQELSTLLEKHINTPVRKSIEQASSSLSLSLKHDLDTVIVGLRSQIKKTSEAVDELSDDVSKVRNAIQQTDAMVRQLGQAQETRHEELLVAFSDAEHRQASADERLVKQGQAQLHHLSGVLKSISSDVHEQYSVSQATLAILTSQIDEVVQEIKAVQDREILSNKVTKRRFVWLFVGLVANVIVIAGGFYKSFIG